jgi:hypothetical protein
LGFGSSNFLAWSVNDYLSGSAADHLENHVNRLSLDHHAALAEIFCSVSAPALSLSNPGATGFVDRIILAEAMMPPTGMMDAQHPMPMNERYGKRFPQPALVRDVLGLPVLDLNSSTLGYVEQVVRNSAGSIKFIVSYSRWWGWFGRPVAVPLEALGIEGRQLVSLDMPPGEYAAAPTFASRWNSTRRVVPQLDDL